MSGNNFQKIADILKTTDVVKPVPSFVRSALFQAWTSSAGAKVAKHTLNLKKEGVTLVVFVDSNIWAHAVNHRRETILERMRLEGHDELSVMSIRIKLTFSKKAAAYRQPLKQPQPKRISPELRKTFEHLAQKTKSPKIRETFLRMSKIRSKE